MKYQIILSLSSLANYLYKRGYNDYPKEILEYLEKILNEEDLDYPDADGIANIQGLRGDVKPEDMSQGFSVDPFFSKSGPLTSE